MPERVTRSYHENVSSEVSPFPAANGKEKKKPSFAGLVGCLLKAKKANKKVKEAKYGLESVEEHEAPREARERGHAKQGYKKEAPIIVEFILPPKQPIDGYLGSNEFNRLLLASLQRTTSGTSQCHTHEMK